MIINSCQERIIMVVFLSGAYYNGRFLSGAHYNGRFLSGAHQDGRFLSGACQEPVRTVRTIRKIKILPGPPGGLQEASRRPPGSWHPNKILMYTLPNSFSCLM